MTTVLSSGLEAKIATLDGMIARFERVAVAYSGGVDSAALLHACLRVLGAERVLAVIADSASLPRAEREEALALARSMKAQLEILATQEIENPAYRANDGERCYFCKKELFSAMETMAKSRGIPVLAYGAIADDLLESRPGSRAAREFRVVAPLQEAGFSKEEIREYSRRHGLPTASKASFACLASRIPQGTEVTPQALARIELAEDGLRRRHFRQFRVRMLGEAAKIEVGSEETVRLLGHLGIEVAKELCAIGFQEVFLDLRGYRAPAAANFVLLENPFWSRLELASENMLRVPDEESRARLAEEIRAKLVDGDLPQRTVLWPIVSKD